MKSVLILTAVVEACNQAAHSTARSLCSFYRSNRGNSKFEFEFVSVEKGAGLSADLSSFTTQQYGKTETS